MLIVRAGPGTLIEISTCEKTLNFAFPLRLQVGNDFTIEPAMTRSSISVHRSVAMTLQSTRDHNPTQMTLADDDLLAIFADMTLPTWLREILDSQLLHWNKHHAETYYQFTPWPVIGEEFARCVRAAPYWALARWQRELFPSQISYCMRKSPAGAVAFALQRIPAVMRKSLIFRFAGEALTHAADQLTEDEILTCADRNPYAVLRHRRKFIPAVRAKILAQVVPMVRMSPEGTPRGLETDILESIAEFPLAWLKHYESFAIVMDKLAKHLSINPDGAALLKLYEKMDPTGQDAFLNFIATRI